MALNFTTKQITLNRQLLTATGSDLYVNGLLFGSGIYSPIGSVGASGSNLYIMLTGLSGQMVLDYATKISLASTGQEAWTAANNNAINLSGNLFSTGSGLWQRDLDISGVLTQQLNSTAQLDVENHFTSVWNYFDGNGDFAAVAIGTTTGRFGSAVVINSPLTGDANLLEFNRANTVVNQIRQEYNKFGFYKAEQAEWDFYVDYSGQEFHFLKPVQFYPNDTGAGINVGSLGGDPSSVTNGDIWYNSLTNQLKARINDQDTQIGGNSYPTGLFTGTIDSSPVVRVTTGQQLEVLGAGASGSAPASTNLNMLVVQPIHGGTGNLLGEPDGWWSIMVSGRSARVPYYYS